DKPEPLQLELEPANFPTRHLLELLDKAGEGENFYETTIFDGSENADSVMTTTVVIGRSATPTRNDPELQAIAPLDAEPFWPVDIAYFDLDGQQGEELPAYRISFKLHESGV